MKTIVAVRPHQLNALHEELLAGIPVLRPVMGGDGKFVAVMVVSGDGETLVLEVPDEADAAAIEAVIAAHDPTPPPAPPDADAELLAAIAQAQAQAAAATTVAGMRGAFDALCNALSGKLRPGRVAGRPV